MTFILPSCARCTMCSWVHGRSHVGFDTHFQAFVIFGLLLKNESQGTFWNISSLSKFTHSTPYSNSNHNKYYFHSIENMHCVITFRSKNTSQAHLLFCEINPNFWVLILLSSRPIFAVVPSNGSSCSNAPLPSSYHPAQHSPSGCWSKITWFDKSGR